MATIANLAVSVTARIGSLEKGFKRAQRVVSRFGGRVIGNAIKRVGQLTAAFTAMFAVMSARKSGGFERSIAEISTLVNASQQEIDALSGAVLHMSERFGAAPADQAKALYQIISAGAENSAEAINTLDAANKLALGGVTDVATAADGLTSVMNAYGNTAGTVTDVSDAMFVAMRAGKTTIDQLSTSVGKAAPLASQLGVNIDELLAAVSALTKGGLATAEAMTSVRAILVAVARQSPQSIQMAEKLGLDFSLAALESKGLAGFLQEVADKVDGNNKVLPKLFAEIEGLTGVMALTGSQAESFNAILDSMGSKSGETETAVDKMSRTVNQQWEKLKSRATTLAIEVGNVLLPKINTFMDVLLSGSKDGGLNFFVKGIFAVQKAFVALGEASTKVARFIVESMQKSTASVAALGEGILTLSLKAARALDALPGTSFLVSDEDIRRMESDIRSIQDFALGVLTDDSWTKALDEQIDKLQEIGDNISKQEIEELKRVKAIREGTKELIDQASAADKRNKAVQNAAEGAEKLAASVADAEDSSKVGQFIQADRERIAVGGMQSGKKEQRVMDPQLKQTNSLLHKILGKSGPQPAVAG